MLITPIIVYYLVDQYTQPELIVTRRIGDRVETVFTEPSPYLGILKVGASLLSMILLFKVFQTVNKSVLKRAAIDD